MNICVVFGTRPEFIKLAPVIEQLRKTTKLSKDSIIVVSSGQHRELLDDVFDAFEVKVDVQFNLMQQNQTSNEFLYRAIEKFDTYFKSERVSMVVVHGDTGTAASAALSAHHNQIPVVHVEAGLRSGDIWAPWPEESNRLIIDAISSIHFAPTKEAANNLVKEGHQNSVHVTGNTIVDALQSTVKKINTGVLEISVWLKAIIDESRYPVILVTQHRRENFGEPLENILDALDKIANLGFTIVFPIHPNPNVKKIVQERLSKNRNIHLVSSLSYSDLVYVLTRSKLIITDSGGLQEEGPTLGIPVLVTREKTERPEGISNGSVKLVGTSTSMIFEKAAELLKDKHVYETMSKQINPYGDGMASIKIVDIILNYLATEL